MNQQLQLFQWTRKNITHILHSVSDEEALVIPGGFNNNLLWNAGHIIWVQQILVYQLAGLPTLLPEGFDKKYATGTVCNPFEPGEGSLITELMTKTTEQLPKDYHRGIFKSYSDFSAKYDQVAYQFTEWQQAFQYNNIHEARHYGFMVALSTAIRKGSAPVNSKI